MSLVEPVICSTYTRARRYPLIVARVWGRRISLNASVGVALGLALAWVTRALWQHGLLDAHAFKVYLLVGLGSGVFLQRGRLDGRAPLWTVYAVLIWLLTDLPRAIARSIEARPVTVELSIPPAQDIVARPTQNRRVHRWTTTPEAA